MQPINGCVVTITFSLSFSVSHPCIYLIRLLLIMVPLFGFILQNYSVYRHFFRGCLGFSWMFDAYMF